MIRRRREGLWITDVGSLVRRDESWAWQSEGGATWSDLPLERDWPRDDPFGVFNVSVSSDGNHQCVVAAGFAGREVAGVEVAALGVSRRNSVNVVSGAFIVALRVPAEPELDTDEIDVRALDVAGAELDSRTRHRDRGARSAGSHMSVAEAVLLPAGASASVTGYLLVIEGQPLRLCDDADSKAKPPSPVGDSLIVEFPGAAELPPSWSPGS